METNPINYACYRTKSLGWQQAGYIVVIATAPSLDDLPTAKDNPDLWGNTAWVANDEGQYLISHTYPELVPTRKDRASDKTSDKPSNVTAKKLAD
ncbi:hypothetical protein GT348_07320 [Aristophania vespae]|uniref:Uncharacterized protein n=1 Tax=Aristophania vespae TaxID=2697033 RepID=A0A6P1NK84_9PROT|nr:hypothetical protein [Aristophania vespae]QHI96072.1 hypothetical protein GT348_07320 [Aristophania vespae]